MDKSLNENLYIEYLEQFIGQKIIHNNQARVIRDLTLHVFDSPSKFYREEVRVNIWLKEYDNISDKIIESLLGQGDVLLRMSIPINIPMPNSGFCLNRNETIFNEVERAIKKIVKKIKSQLVEGEIGKVLYE